MDIWDAIEADADRGAQRLVDEYGNRLFAAACVMCQDRAAAEDLVFRTLSQAVRKIAQYREDSPFFNWLYSIMINFRRMDMRGKGPELVYADALEDPPDAQYDGAEELIAHVDAAIVRDALRHISPIHREVMLLRYFEDRSITEIADILQIPQGTVMSRLHNACAALHRLLTTPSDMGKDKA